MYRARQCAHPLLIHYQSYTGFTVEDTSSVFMLSASVDNRWKLIVVFRRQTAIDAASASL